MKNSELQILRAILGQWITKDERKVFVKDSHHAHKLAKIAVDGTHHATPPQRGLKIAIHTTEGISSGGKKWTESGLGHIQINDQYFGLISKAGGVYTVVTSTGKGESDVKAYHGATAHEAVKAALMGELPTRTPEDRQGAPITAELTADQLIERETGANRQALMAQTITWAQAGSGASKGAIGAVRNFLGTSAGSDRIAVNHVLRHGGTNERGLKAIPQLDAAMADSKTPIEVVVHKGLDGSWKDLNNLLADHPVGKRFQDHGFSLASIGGFDEEDKGFSISGSTRIGPIKMTIILPAGISAMPTSGISNFRAEVLLDRGLEFEILHYDGSDVRNRQVLVKAHPGVKKEIGSAASAKPQV